MRSQDKPKFMIPELIIGAFCVCILFACILVFPEVMVAALDYKGIIATDAATIILRETFYSWLGVWVFTGFTRFVFRLLD